MSTARWMEEENVYRQLLNHQIQFHDMVRQTMQEVAVADLKFIPSQSSWTQLTATQLACATMRSENRG
jgi:hypothetical protein